MAPPPKRSSFTDEQFTQLQSFVDAKWKGREQCPRCGTNQWDLSGRTYFVMSPATGNIGWNAPQLATIPVAVFTCHNCAHIDLLNLIAAGIEVPESEPPDDEGKP